LRAAAPGEEAPRSVTVEFDDSKVLKVARGANVSLKVRAAQAPLASITPQACTVYYRTLRSGDGIRGERGSVTMSNYRDSGGWRNFWFDNKPFKSVLASVEFDVTTFGPAATSWKSSIARRSSRRCSI
jgi:hypothetical protein